MTLPIPTIRMLILALLAGLSPTAASAVQSGPAARWVAFAGSPYCILARTRAGAEDYRFAFRLIPGADEFDLLFPGTGPIEYWRHEPVTVTVEPGGQSSEARLGAVQFRDGRMRRVYGFDADFIRQLEGAERLRIAKGDNQIAAIPFPRDDGALASFRECRDSTLANWGIDPAVRASLQRPPVPIDDVWLRPSDFPLDAYRSGTHGLAVMRLRIDPSGRVVDCTMLHSAGPRALGDRACRMTVRRARYHPALDAQGLPVSADDILAVRFAVFN